MGWVAWWPALDEFALPTDLPALPSSFLYPPPQALALFILMAFLFVRSAWVTRCVALLVGALAVRCHLKPAEVERIMAVAGAWARCCAATTADVRS